MATKNFVYSTTLSTGPDAGDYAWSATNNWSPTGLPGATSNVVVGFSLHTVVDDIPNLTINSLVETASLTIGAGNTLDITGSVAGQPGISIINGFPITIDAGASLVAIGSGDSGIYEMQGSGDLLSLGGDFTHGSVGFDGVSGDAETFLLTSATVDTALSSATVFNFGAGDAIWFNSPQFALADHVVLSGTSLFLENAGGSVLYTIGNFSEAGAGGLGLQVTQVGVGAEITVVCFAAGTRIATADGETAVEALAEGDLVATQERGETALRPVKWVGRRRIDLKAHPRPELAAPVHIRAGAFAEGLPARDLVLSPDHCLFIDGKLIPAKLLINGATIVQDLDCRSVQYFHVELDRHAVLLAEGLPAESYLDTGNRAFFANAGMALVLHPEFHVNAGLRCWDDACAPLAVDEATVRPIWSALAERAAMLGHALPSHATVTDPDLRLMANGRTIRPTLVEGDRYVFTLPHGTGGVTLVSRTGLPTDLVPYCSDWRRLGVGVGRITLSRGADRIDLPIDHPTLVQGWHAPEQLGSERWRWTQGAAFLPIPATDFGIVTLTIELGRNMSYLDQVPVPLAA